MTKIAFVKVKFDDTIHRIPATDAREEVGEVVIYDGENVVGRFGLHKVEHWGFELAEGS